MTKSYFQKGNETFKKNTRQAYNSYLKGYKILDSHSPADEEEEWKLQEEKVTQILAPCQEQHNYWHLARSNTTTGILPGVTLNLLLSFRLQFRPDVSFLTDLQLT